MEWTWDEGKAVNDARAVDFSQRVRYNVDMASKSLPVPAGWLDTLERSKADIAAGRSVPLEPILARLRRTADQLEAEYASAKSEAKQKTH